MRWLSISGLLPLAFVWSCGGCGGSPGGGPDLAAGDGRGLDARPDTRRTDVLQPDTVPAACGGSRTVTPIEIPRDGGYDCGKGCRQVTFGDSATEYDVAGDLLVYSGGGSIYRKVHLVDLKQDKEWLIHERPNGEPGCFTVATDGRTASYTCSIWPNPRAPSYIQALYRYDPATGAESDLQCWTMVVDNSNTSAWLGIGNSGIVVDMSLVSDRGTDAFFYRFSDGTLTNLSQRDVGVYTTRISGSRIVWMQNWKTGDPPYSQIVLYDTGTRQKRLLAPNAANQYEPRIRGDRVVWEDNRNSPGTYLDKGNSDIYVHDLVTGQTMAACTHPAQQQSADVEGDLVVWEDWRNNKPTPTPKYGSDYQNSDVYMKDLKSGKEVQLTAFTIKGFKDIESRVRIDRKRVFFTMTAQKTLSVFMIDLAAAGLLPSPPGG